ncbi:MAG: hypothetical protein PHD58_01105 [Anaerolineales bacterium]|nr:hypothetical protein [Anaerolineales bacterium]
MTLPALFLGILLSTLYGCLFHLWRGGKAGRLILYLILGWLGFWSGHILGVRYGWEFGRIGPLYVGSATAFSIFFLFAGYWLSLVEVNRN